MALSDNPNEKTRKRNKPKRKDLDGNFRYSDKQKMEAVTSWLALGNLALTARLLDIPEVTLRVWKASDWWRGVVEDIKLQEKVALSARMKNLIEASQQVVAQRLETGDAVLTPKGEIVYKPVSLRDAHRVAVDTINQKNILDKAVMSDEPSTDEGSDNKLEKLAERFAEMATRTIEKEINKRRTVEAEDVEIINAVHEERETRLQDGVPEIPFEAGTNREPDGSDDGTQAS